MGRIMRQLRGCGSIARRVAVCVALAELAAVSFLAPDRVLAAGCDETGTSPAEIAQAGEDLDIALKDDRSVRLAGVKSLSSGAASHLPDTPLTKWIADAAAGKTVTLRPLSPVGDRWGRITADMFVGGRNLQVLLAQAGLVVARPDDLRGPCWEAVKAAEAQARRANAGVWALPQAILPATDGAKLTERDGAFILASGQVRHVSRGKGRSYVDFGARGTNALFLTIDTKALTRMEKLGFKLEQLNERKILVRGVVSNGPSPHMVIDDVDAIEFWD